MSKSSDDFLEQQESEYISMSPEERQEVALLAEGCIIPIKHLDVNIQLPVKAELLSLFDECGYRLTAQGAYTVIYMKDNVEICISEAFGLTIKRDGAIETMFPILHLESTEIAMALHSLRILDLKKVYKESRYSKYPGGNAGIFSHITKHTA